MGEILKSRTLYFVFTRVCNPIEVVKWNMHADRSMLEGGKKGIITLCAKRIDPQAEKNSTYLLRN